MEVKLISVCLLKCFSGLLKTDMQRNGTKASEQQSKNNELVLCGTSTSFNEIAAPAVKRDLFFRRHKTCENIIFSRQILLPCQAARMLMRPRGCAMLNFPHVFPTLMTIINCHQVCDEFQNFRNNKANKAKRGLSCCRVPF